MPWAIEAIAVSEAIRTHCFNPVRLCDPSRGTLDANRVVIVTPVSLTFWQVSAALVAVPSVVLCDVVRLLSAMVAFQGGLVDSCDCVSLPSLILDSQLIIYLVTNTSRGLEFIEPSSISDVPDYLCKPAHLEFLADRAFLATRSEFVCAGKCAECRLTDRTAEGLKCAVYDLRVHRAPLYQLQGRSQNLQNHLVCSAQFLALSKLIRLGRFSPVGPESLHRICATYKER